MKDTAGGTHLVHNTAENAHRAESLVRSKISGELVEGLAQKAGKDFPTVRLKDTIASGFDEVGALKERWVVPKGYDSLDDFLKVVDDTTIKDFGYDSIDDFKTVVGHVDDYLKASPNNNILNKGLAGGTHMKGIDYDVLGFPIFKGDDMKFTFKLGEDKFVASDSSQFKKCTEVLQAAIKRGDIPKDMFTAKQLAQIEAGKARISGLTWHHHQVPGKMQLVNSQAHSVNHLGGNTLWGGGVR
ncbi:HNH endonuclease [Listeria sp. FSL L7-1582]|nr:HNH endonuclease [Listeria portnoyi]